MIAKTLVFVCAAFGLVAGSCFEVCPQQFVPSCQQQVVQSCQQQVVPSCQQQIVTIPAVPAVQECQQVQSCGVPECVVSAPSTSENSFIEVAPVSGSSCCLQAGNGPETSPVPVIQAPAVTLPAVEGPTVTLSSQPIPAPRVLAQRCICTKTIVKPQVYQRTVTVPRIQRYVKRTVTPVVENVAYKSTPISQECGSSSVYVAAGSGSGSGSSSSCGSQSRIVFSSSSSSSCPKIC